MVAALEGLHHFRQEWLEPLAADEIGDSPDILEGFVGAGIPRWLGSLAWLFLARGLPEQCYRVLSTVAGRLGNSVEDTSLFAFSCPTLVLVEVP